MKNSLNLNLHNWNPRNRQPGSTLLGLSFDGSRLDVVLVQRTNGSADIKKSFSVTLSLDPLTNAPELVGREIRKALDEQGIRERWCTVCIPLHWALTLTTKLPGLPEGDIASFLQVEAERGFPYGPEALLTANSRFKLGTDSWATTIAVPRTHLSRLEAVLAAAQLRVASFSLGIAALQPTDAESADGVLALVPGESNIHMQLTVGGGIAVLRTIEGAFEMEGAERQLQTDHVAREVRITLGQMAPEVRAAVKLVRVFGKSEDAEELAEMLMPRLEMQGLKVEQVRTHSVNEFGVKVPIHTPASAALALVMRRLAGKKTALEFLPPKVSAWQQISSKYSSPKLVTVGVTVGAIAAVILLAFLVQQSLLWYWGHRWDGIKKQVYTLEDTKTNIRKYRAWYDTSFRELTILRRLTEAFPEDGTVSAKQIEIRDPNKPGELLSVTCTGTAHTRAGLLSVKDKLAKARNVQDIHTQMERGTTPMEFTFDFKWSEGGQ